MEDFVSLIGHFPVLSIYGNCIEYGYLNPILMIVF